MEKYKLGERTKFQSIQRQSQSKFREIADFLQFEEGAKSNWLFTPIFRKFDTFSKLNIKFLFFPELLFGVLSMRLKLNKGLSALQILAATLLFFQCQDALFW